ncbi:MAG: MerR family transcriptional regulator [Bacteroidales bacterium]
MDNYHIGEIAKFYKVSTDTIRLYDKKGILSPMKNETNNYRTYTRENLLCMDYIMRLRKMGIPLSTIDKVLNEYLIDDLCSTFENQNIKVQEEIEKLQIAQKTIEQHLEIFNRIKREEGKITVKKSPIFICRPICNTIMEELEVFSRLNKTKVPLFMFLHKGVTPEGPLDYGENLRDRNKRPLNQEIMLTIDDPDGSISSAPDFPKEQFKVLQPRLCLNVIGKEYINKKYDGFFFLAKYIKENNIKTADFCVVRMLTTTENNKNETDYYDLWMPLE